MQGICRTKDDRNNAFWKSKKVKIKYDNGHVGNESVKKLSIRVSQCCKARKIGVLSQK